MRAILALLPLTLAACATEPPARPEPPPPAPAIIKVPVATYVTIDAALLRRCTWRERAAPSEVFAVARERKACLLRYEAQLEGIGKIEGKPVPAPQK